MRPRNKLLWLTILLYAFSYASWWIGDEMQRPVPGEPWASCAEPNGWHRLGMALYILALGFTAGAIRVWNESRD